jgi:hypothetical protein
MQVARDRQGGPALMVLAVDRAIAREHLEQLRAISGMKRVEAPVF